MDDLSKHAGKMIEIMNNRRNHYRSLENEISDIAQAVYHLIIRLQVLEIGIKDMRGDEKMNKDIIEKSFQEWEERDAKKLDVGGRIAKILCERKMTQRELAQKCHITEVSMSRYINNSRMTKGTVIVDVAKALGVSADYLLGLSDMRGDSDEVN